MNATRGVVSAGLALLVAGCTVTTEPFTEQEMRRITAADRLTIEAGTPPITAPLTLSQAVARALKYNLDNRVQLMEQSLASDRLNAGRFDMLPQLLASAGYSWRDTENTRASLDPVTGAPLSDTGAISSENEHTLYELGFSWSLLDFGTSYYTARQNADRLLIAGEQRRKTMHTLMQQVVSGFWRAYAAQQLIEQVDASIREADQALMDSRQVSAMRVNDPGIALRYQRNLLENVRLMEEVRRDLISAKIELANLMGLLPGTAFTLAAPPTEVAELPDLDLPALEAQALLKNVDLRKEFYNARIAATETRVALLKLLPGLRITQGPKYDSDDLLIEQNWSEAGAVVSFNLMNLLSGPARMRQAETGRGLAEARRVALQMAVVTQVHLSHLQYLDAVRQYRRTNAIYEVDQQLARLAADRRQAQVGDELDRISSHVSAILSTLKRYTAIARVHEAKSRLDATIGREPPIGSVDTMTIDELADIVAAMGGAPSYG